MALINMTLQGKGGVGKSLVSSLMAQHYAATGKPTQNFDTDPVNQTFAGYKAFKAETIQLGERQDEIDPRSFDVLMEKLINAPKDGVVVVDNGASTFLPLLSYLVESQALSMLVDAGHEVRVHSVLTGGQALEDTMQGFAQILAYVPNIPVVVWLNEYFGRVERRKGGGVETFEQSQLFKKNSDRIYGVVRLPEVRKETFGRDIEEMMQARLTFDEAVNSELFTIMARQRLRQTWRVLDEAMETAVL